jgi:hypothetical protein
MSIRLSKRQQNVLAFFSVFSVLPEKSRFDAFWGSDSRNILFSFFPEKEPHRNVPKKYFLKAKKWGMFLRFIPFVRAVAIVNTVALGIAENKSDIDLLLVVQKGRMWTARLFVTVFFALFGIRRNKKKIAGKICLSFFVDEEMVSFDGIKKKKDPYLAFWVAGMIPLFGKQYFSAVKEKNMRWVQSEIALPILFSPPLKNVSCFQHIFEYCFPPFFEKAIRKVWKRRTLKKAASLRDPFGTVITDSILKFHDHDKREEIRKKFGEKKFFLGNDLKS